MEYPAAAAASAAVLSLFASVCPCFGSSLIILRSACTTSVLFKVSLESGAVIVLKMICSRRIQSSVMFVSSSLTCCVSVMCVEP